MRATALVASFVALFACGAESTSCPDGAESCACSVDGACMDDLSCREGTCVRGTCGDGLLDPREECDDGQANGDREACTSICLRAVCGDALVQAGVEECDDGDLDATDGCADCRRTDLPDPG